MTVAQLVTWSWAPDLARPGDWVVIVVAAAAVVLLWPGRSHPPTPPGVRGSKVASARPVGRPSGQAPPRVRPRRLPRTPVPVGSPVSAALLAGTAGGALLGTLPGLAAGLAAFTAGNLAGGAARDRRRQRTLAHLAAGLRLLSRELRSGASVPQACAMSATAATGVAADLLETLAREARFGLAGATHALASTGDAEEVATMHRRMSAALRLSARRGIPLAELIDAFAADVEARAALADRRATEVAGPQLSGFLLAALPVFGLLLGAAMGAAPLTVLLRTSVGQLLLLVGVGLSCLGLAWISRIVRT